MGTVMGNLALPNGRWSAQKYALKYSLQTLLDNVCFEVFIDYTLENVWFAIFIADTLGQCML